MPVSSFQPYDPYHQKSTSSPSPEQSRDIPPIGSGGGFDRSPPRKSNTCLIVTLVFGSIFGVGSICICGSIFLFMVPKDTPVTDTDRAMVVDAYALQSFIEFDPSSGSETMKKSKYFDGSYELEYEFEDPSDEGILLTYSLAVERSIDEAEAGYLVTWEAIKLGTKLAASGAEVQFDEQNDVFRWGDRSRFVILTSEGIPFGNIFITQKGNKIVTLVLANAYFDDELVAELLLPKLELVESYSP